MYTDRYNQVRANSLAAKHASDPPSRAAQNAAQLAKWHATLAAGQHVKGHQITR